MDSKKEVKKKVITTENIFLEGERPLYSNGDMIITPKRVIKHKTGKMSWFSEIFSEDYQDLDLQRVVSIKIEERMNIGFVKIGMVLLLLVPLLLALTQIQSIENYISYLSFYVIKISTILLVVSMVLFVLSFAFKKEVLSIFGEGGARMDFHSYDHNDFLAIRKYQYSSRKS